MERRIWNGNGMEISMENGMERNEKKNGLVEESAAANPKGHSCSTRYHACFARRVLLFEATAVPTDDVSFRSGKI